MSFGHSESTMGPDNHVMNFYRTSTQYCENIHLTITAFLEYSHYRYILVSVEISFALHKTYMNCALHVLQNFQNPKKYEGNVH